MTDPSIARITGMFGVVLRGALMGAVHLCESAAAPRLSMTARRWRSTYNGSIAFAITGLFMAAAGWATLDSGILPRWTGSIAWISAVLRAVHSGDVRGPIQLRKSSSAAYMPATD